MPEHLKATPFQPKRDKSVQCDTRRELHTTPRRHLDPVRRQRRIVTDGHQHGNVDQSSRGSRVESQSQDATTARSGKFRPYDDEAILRIECEVQSAIAVSPGIVPVYTMAKRLGRSWTAWRYTSSRSLPCQRTVPPRTSRDASVDGSSISTHSDSNFPSISVIVRISSIINTLKRL